MKPAIALLTTLLLSSFALASTPKRQVSLPVGHSMTMAMPAPVTSVRVDDPSLVEVKREGRKVTLVARARGSTDATVQTAEGEDGRAHV
jgi:Flp pilus assembly secretin CpaC